MKPFSLKSGASRLGTHIRRNPIFPLFPENALFWMLLLLLSIGSVFTLHDKISARDQAKPANTAPEAAGYYYEYPLTSGSLIRIYEP